MHRRTVISGVAAMVAGCAGLEQDPPTAEVIPGLHEQTVEDGEYVSDIKLRINAHRTNNPATFDDISIGFYDESQKSIVTHSVGTISSDPPRNTVDLTMRAPSVPYYIVVESDEFWSQDQFEMDIVGWKQPDSDYRFMRYRYGSQEDKFSG